MQEIRSFIAIPIPAAIAKSAATLVRRLSHDGDGIKWVPSENLHLTLKFLGDVDNRQVPEVCQVVRNCCAGIQPFEIDLCGADAFPNTNRLRVVVVRIGQGGEQLATIVERLESQLANLGFKPEARDYVPHMTLGRTRGGSRRGSPELARSITENTNYHVGQMSVDQVYVMASFLDKAGATYQVMDTIKLS